LGIKTIYHPTQFHQSLGFFLYGVSDDDHIGTGHEPFVELLPRADTSANDEGRLGVFAYLSDHLGTYGLVSPTACIEIEAPESQHLSGHGCTNGNVGFIRRDG
jgi:hypothetical protein